MKEYLNILTTSEIKKELVNALECDDWGSAFCVNNKGETVKYTKEENKVLSLADIGPSGTCYDETTAWFIIRNALIANIDDVITWIKSKEHVYRFSIDLDVPVGYVIANGNRYDTSLVRITLRRAIDNSTKYGFFVAAVHPQIQN